MTLELLQHDFYKAILEESTSIHESIASSYPAQRLATYQHTIFHTLTNALALTFPGIWKLLGEDCANHLAKIFFKQGNNLPISGCLDDWGAQFPDFISQEQRLRDLPYLKDYARLEWLKHLSFCAPSTSSINTSELESIQQGSLESLKIIFKPSFFTLRSEYPLDKIEALIENPKAEAVNLNANNSQALITRQENKVLVLWIKPDLYDFIHALEKNMSLGQAFKNTVKSHPDFDLTETLTFIFHNNLINTLSQT